MGGGYTSVNYDYSPSAKSERSESGAFGGYSKSAAQEVEGNTKAHPSSKPTRTLTSDAANPIVIALDDTGSMGSGTHVIRDKFPVLFGQLNLQGYVQDPAISFMIVGDHTCDSSPLQAFDFAKGDECQAHLGKAYLEGGGGWGTLESYELPALMALRRCELPNMERGFVFIIGDESPHPQVDDRTLKVLGLKGQNMSTQAVFSELSEKMEVVFIQISYGGSRLETPLGTTLDVRNSWLQYLPEERVMYLSDPKGVIDLILGATALLNGTRTLDGYVSDLRGENGIREEGQTEERISAVRAALTPLWDQIQSKSLKRPARTGRAALVHRVED